MVLVVEVVEVEIDNNRQLYQINPNPFCTHCGVYYLQDRDTRPKVWHTHALHQ